MATMSTKQLTAKERAAFLIGEAILRHLQRTAARHHDAYNEPTV
jgi:hypothetical protein